MSDQMAMGVYSALKNLRKRGWKVAVHNDYTVNGKHHTFWLFTASHGPYFAKGEATEDFYALNQVLNQVDEIEKWSRQEYSDIKDCDVHGTAATERAAQTPPASHIERAADAQKPKE